MTPIRLGQGCKRAGGELARVERRMLDRARADGEALRRRVTDALDHAR